MTLREKIEQDLNVQSETLQKLADDYQRCLDNKNYEVLPIIRREIEAWNKYWEHTISASISAEKDGDELAKQNIDSVAGLSAFREG
jgi:hypothetical protein